ncbi:LOW QUALITY PROTEIN: unconventional myosin-VIIa-like [Lethenteron reissneri]|uniref:LOW QUALITY PROTEIN: unconventional myosin-VIIa-like n=1 Tax=Lethenteron reissneri TaxID=7753 RepID=UPI002AB77192|nr:LOW QUALITY PROTEIN: unconventional myosin-VIIa-like [Lethenteron reissneri]
MLCRRSGAGGGSRSGGDMVILRQGDHVFLDVENPGEFAVPTGAVVKLSDSGKVLLLDDEGTEHWVTPANESLIRMMHPTSVTGVEDMIRLGTLHEEGILRNLLTRYREAFIYTYTGSILVAVNPYKTLNVYSPEAIQQYRGRKVGELPPHIFALADNAHFNMRRNERNQCCIISGESGAGKTESTKLILQFLAAVSGQHSWVEQQILEANPILEAFGNAKTIRNDNSSRFGKYVEIHFNEKSVIEGARIEQYLLEKTRVCGQAEQERNYHIFYCLLLGSSDEQKKRLGLGKPADYAFLTTGNCTRCDGRDDLKDFASIRSAMKVLAFSETEYLDISKMLASILHLGNLKLQGTVSSNIECCEILTNDHLTWASKLLEVDEAEVQECLTKKVMLMRGEKVTTLLSMAQTQEVRNAFVKAIYGKMFVWIVDKMNSIVYKPPSRGGGEQEEERRSIGLLDIFGFENFQTNSFEQFCINLANEALQQFFVGHIFKLEQEEYERESISWKNITFTDNQEALDMISSRPLNLIALIDEESKFPQGTDATMLAKLTAQHKKNAHFIPPRSNHSTRFGISHFAGDVFYESSGFLEKNRDSLIPDILALVQSSKNSFLTRIFASDLNTDKGSIPFHKRAGDSVRVHGTLTHRRPTTLSGQFRKSLEELMKALGLCQPWFIRCIKPNDVKKPLLFDRELFVRQLRYSGMMETIRIRRSGYPIRYTFAEFVERYRFTLPGFQPKEAQANPMGTCKKILGATLGKDEDFQIGKNKVFLKDNHDMVLELSRDKSINDKVTKIQGVMRVYVARKRFLKMRAASVMIQKHWRGYSERRFYLTIKLGLARLQAVVQSRKLVLQFSRTRRAAVVIQAHARGLIARRRYRLHKTQGLPMVQEEFKEDMDLDRNEDKMLDEIFGFLGLTAMEEMDHVGMDMTTDLDEDLGQRGDDDDDDDEEEKRRRGELRDYTFAKFAAVNFQGSSTHTHERRLLRVPLLHHQDETDRRASVAVWRMVLRFMGDLPEPQATGGQGARDPNRDPNRVSIIRVIYESLQNPRGAKGTEWLEEAPLNNLQKVHFIIGYAILRPAIRDEIYCQICKQIGDNLIRSSYARGWILLSLCLGCFPPSDNFSKYLRSFLSEGPPGYAPYCDARLKRTLANGCRTQPPSWLEMQATKSRRVSPLPVGLMDGRTVPLSADSACTARELVAALAGKIGLQDDFGFSLFISFQNKVSSLGGGREHVLDAVSQCEQLSREQAGGTEQAAPWRLIFRKELFAPWHDAGADAVATELIYRQVVRGLRFGEYRADTDSELVQLVAWRCFVQHGASPSAADVAQAVAETVPERALTAAKHRSVWAGEVEEALRQSDYAKQGLSALAVQEKMVDFARVKWPVLFSRFFEAYKVSGPSVLKSELIAAVSSVGLHLLDGDEHVLMLLTFPEIVAITTASRRKLAGPAVTMSTLRGDEIVLATPAADEFNELLVLLLQGLRSRSRHLVAMQESRVIDGDAGVLACHRGDLIVLEGDKAAGEALPQGSWTQGRNDRTGLTGEFLSDSVYVLPVLEKPSKAILSLFAANPEGQRRGSTVSQQPEDRNAFYTLEQFAQDHFRPLPQGTVKQVVEVRGRRKDRLWACSREPLLQPLLHSVIGDHVAKDACNAFIAILKYMGDFPMRQATSDPGTDLTDQVFRPALKNACMQDEIYCQILKQLTDNKQGYSEEKGWELLWLCLGLFPPGAALAPHVQEFLKSRQRTAHVARLNRSLQNSGFPLRRYPPHLREVKAAQHKSRKLHHPVSFPDQSEQTFEVDAGTRVRELCLAIAKKLQLKSQEGFCLFIKILDKVVSMPDGDFFFDFARQMEEWSCSGRVAREGQAAAPMPEYQVHFLRKLWVNVVPGKDPTADNLFHYPQELPKFLRGFHKVSREDAVQLAALVFRARHGDERAAISSIGRSLKELLPHDLLPDASTDAWKKLIVAAVSKNAGKTHDEAKLAFLKIISRWPTFGTTFFDVKQISEPTYPDILRIAINKHGLSLINPKTKDILAQHSFTKIFNWSSGSTYFHITIGSAVNGTKLLCETFLGYKVDDLLTSYINLLMSKQQGDTRSAGNYR